MKKIIRIAIALAITGSSLLYTGCTKDYSGDINKLQNEVTEVQAAVKSLNDFKASAQSAISKAEENIGKNAEAIKAANDAVAELDGRISDLESDFDYYIPAIIGAVNELYDCVEELYGNVDDLFSNDQILLELIKACYLDCLDELSALDVKINGLSNRITAINIVPSELSNQVISVATRASGEGKTIKFASFEFQVWPRSAAKYVLDEELTVDFMFEGKGAATHKTVSCPIAQTEWNPETGIIKAIACIGTDTDPYIGAKNYYSVSFVGEDAAGVPYEIGSHYEKLKLSVASRDINFDNWILALAKLDEEGFVEDLYLDVQKKGFVEWNSFKDTVFFQNYVPCMALKFDPAQQGYNVLTEKDFKALKCPELFKPEVSYNWLYLRYYNGNYYLGSATPEVLDPFAFDTKTDKLSLVKGTELEDLINEVNYGVLIEKIWSVPQVEGFTSIYFDKNVFYDQFYTLTNQEVELGTYDYEIPWNFVNYEVTNGVEEIVDTLKIEGVDKAILDADVDCENALIYVKGDATKKAVEGASIEFKEVKDNVIPVVAKLPVLNKETVYVAEVKAYAQGYTYTLPIEITVATAPKVELALLDDIEVEAPLYKKQTFKVKVLEKLVNEDNAAEFLGNLPADKYTVNDVYKAMVGDASVKSVLVNGEEANCKEKFTSTIAIDGKGDATVVTCEALGYELEYAVTFKLNKFGVDFEYLQEFLTPDCKATIEEFGTIEDGIATVVGTAKSGVYKIEDIHLKNYVHVVGNTSKDTFEVEFKIKTEGKEGEYGKVTLMPTGYDTFTVDPETGLLTVDDPTIDWYPYTGRKIWVEVNLLDNVGNAVDTKEFSIETKCPIIYGEEWAGSQTVTRAEGETVDIVIPKNFKYAGILEPTQNLVSPEAKYGTVVVVDPTKITATVGGKPFTFVAGEHYTWNALTNTLTILEENADAVMVISVPVEVDYYLDYYNSKKDVHEDALRSTQVITINPKF